MGATGRARFTVIEMTIAVCIVMILAGIAVPSMQTMVLQTKRSEVPVNVDGMVHTNSVAYEAAYGTYVNGLVWFRHQFQERRPCLGRAGRTSTRSNGAPDGAVRGQYATGIGALAICVTELGWSSPDLMNESAGRSDIDEDGTYFFYVCCDGQGSRLHETTCLVKPGREDKY